MPNGCLPHIVMLCLLSALTLAAVLFAGAERIACPAFQDTYAHNYYAHARRPHCPLDTCPVAEVQQGGGWLVKCVSPAEAEQYRKPSRYR